MLSAARYGTRDLTRASGFYDALADLLGAVRVIERDEVIAYQAPDGAMFLIGLPFAGDASVGNGSQIGFSAPSREVVDAVYARALALGGASEGAPGPRGTGGFYAAYFRDLDGNKLMVAHW